MEKLEPTKSQTPARTPTAGKLVGFVGDVKHELKKIEWTSGAELKFYTKVVLVSTFLFGLFIYLVDLSIQGILKGIHLLLS